MRYGNRDVIVPLAVVMTLAASSALAQGPAYGLGRAPTADEVSAWGIIVGPSGQDLPPGSGTAEDGASIYGAKCAYCHGPTGAEPYMSRRRERPFTPEMYCCFPAPLVGGESSLTTLIPVKTVGAYWASATTLWDYIARGMPPNENYRNTRGGYEFAERVNAQGPLSDDDVYALTAFILFQNGLVQERDVMNAESLPNVKMPGRDVMIPADPNTWYPKRQVDPHVSPNSRP
jgi:cytochrome c